MIFILKEPYNKIVVEAKIAMKIIIIQRKHLSSWYSSNILRIELNNKKKE